MTQIVKELPEKLVRLLARLGGRSIVLVEGERDETVFNDWYLERQADVTFFATSGKDDLIALLGTVAAQRPDVSAFGIRDRDFKSEADVQAPLDNPSANVFLLRRYAIENYLLEPDAISEELRQHYKEKLPVPDAAQVEQDLLALCRKLSGVMAVNWEFVVSGGGIKHLNLGFPVDNRQQLIQVAAKSLGCDEAEAEQRVSAREALLEPKLNTLAEAHTCVNGKRLLHQTFLFYIHNVQQGFDEEHFFDLLRREIKRRGLPADVKAIVEDRILGASP